MKLSVFLTFVSLSLAKPDGAPGCAVDGIGPKITAGMGANVRNLKDDYKFTASSTQAVSGQPITITVTGNATYIGVLMYAVGSDPKKRIGKFTTVPSGIKGATGCSAFTLDDPMSVITHSAPGNFGATSTYTYTVPSAGFTGNLTISAVIMQKSANASGNSPGSFQWGVYPAALTLTGTAKGASGRFGVDFVLLGLVALSLF